MNSAQTVADAAPTTPKSKMPMSTASSTMFTTPAVTVTYSP